MNRIIAILIYLLFSLQTNAQGWVQLPTPDTRNLYGCWFDPVQPDTGMGVGWYIQNFDRLPFGYFTSDGGTTITAASLFQIYFYASSDVWFTNSYNGIIVGNGIIQTTDGGINWNLIVDATTTQAGILENVMFTNSTDGYAVGQRYDFNYTLFEGMLYKTKNAGGSWTDYTISQEANNENTLMHTVYSTGNGVLYAGAENSIGSSTLYKSVDDGLTWAQLPFNQSVWSLYFTSADTGFAATSNGIYKTINAGASWTNILPTTSSMHTIQIKNGFGFTAGENGLIYMTNDNGITWSPSLSPVLSTITDISIISPNLAYAVGLNGTFLKYTNSTGLDEPMDATELLTWIDSDQQLNLEWNIKVNSFVSVELVNMNGMVVKTIAKNVMAAGRQTLRNDLSRLSQGVYVVKFRQNSEVINKRIVFLK